MLTAAVRDLHHRYPGRFMTDVRSSCPELWFNNPHIHPIADDDPDALVVDCEYPSIHSSNQRSVHFVEAFVSFLNDKLNLNISLSQFRGDVHLTAAEQAINIEPLRSLDCPYWVVSAGGKLDYTIKWWDHARFQRVVDYFGGSLQFVQVGASEHYHPPLEGVIDLRGKTDIRQLIQVVHHSQGVLCPVTFLMHLAAAVQTKSRGLRPCVVVAGGREPVHWEAYPGHQFIHTIGALHCCKAGGCWRSRAIPLGDGDEKDLPQNRCVDLVEHLPRCMDLIRPEDVIERIKLYFRGSIATYQEKLSEPASPPSPKPTVLTAKPVRVLHFLHHANLAGTERSVFNLCQAFPQSTVGVVFAQEGPALKLFRSAGIPCLVLNQPFSANLTLPFIAKKTDLLAIHLCKFRSEGIELAEFLKVPYVFTLQYPTTLPLLHCPVIVPTRAIAEMQLFGNRCHVIPNGVDVSEFSPGPRDDSGKFRMARVGRPQKSSPLFWPVVTEFLKRSPTAEISIIGERGVDSKQIKFFEPRPDIRDLLAGVDILVHAPKTEDGAHDIAILEAMAMGIPIAGFDVPSVRASVTNRHDGFLVPEEEGSALVEALTRLESQSGFRRELGVNARATVCKRFNIRELVQDHHAVYRSHLLEHRHPPVICPA